MKLLAFVIVFAACKPSESAPHDGPVACTADGDCHAGACGPCNVGDAITEEAALMRECVVNPCPNHTAACVNHVCTITK